MRCALRPSRCREAVPKLSARTEWGGTAASKAAKAVRKHEWPILRAEDLVAVQGIGPYIAGVRAQWPPGAPNPIMLAYRMRLAGGPAW